MYMYLSHNKGGCFDQTLKNGQHINVYDKRRGATCIARPILRIMCIVQTELCFCCCELCVYLFC